MHEHVPETAKHNLHVMRALHLQVLVDTESADPLLQLLVPREFDLKVFGLRELQQARRRVVLPKVVVDREEVAYDRLGISPELLFLRTCQ